MMSTPMNEKVMIRIAGINQITESRVEVILRDSGKKIWLPIKEAERFGSRVFIPSWLARKYKGLNNGTEKPL